MTEIQPEDHTVVATLTGTGIEEKQSSALRTQKAIIESELFWHGRLLGSEAIHATLDSRPEDSSLL